VGVQLLVSVADAADARAAVAGGADVIDAKDPTRGALGAVDPATRSAILAAVGGARPVSAALDDATDAGDLDRLAFVKIAPGPQTSRGPAIERIGGLVDAARRSGCAVVLAAYADVEAAGAGSALPRGLDAASVLEIAVHVGATGLLLDTADKSGPGLFDLLGDAAVADWVLQVHAAGLTAALAGRLGLHDVPRAVAAGADIIGVRGAACDGSRAGRVSVDRVAALVSAARAASQAASLAASRAASRAASQAESRAAALAADQWPAASA